jgi:DNA primase
MHAYTPPPDYSTLKASIDLRALVEKELAQRPQARTKRYWTFLCPFHAESDGSFQVYEQDYHCYGCGAHGDVFSWLQARRGITFPQAVELLGGDPMKGYTPSRYVPLPVEKQPPAIEWQERIEAAWHDLSKNLYHTPQGERAYSWLEQRGLDYHTIDAFDLGFCIGDQVDSQGRKYAMLHGLKVWHGITIRHTVGGQVWAVQVRVPTKERYLCVPGSVKGALFGAECCKGKSTVIIVEGEFDCMLGNQCCYGLDAGCATLGSATDNSEANIKQAHVVSALFGVKRLLVATDSDPAGDAAAQNWLFTKRAIRYAVPQGKDLGEFYTLAGRDAVTQWIEEGMTR